MARRLHQTLADYVVIAISPALIVTLVGSLCFFLLAAFYGGNYEARLTFVMACFVVASTLISRISMEEGIEYASLFGAPLAVLTGMAILKFGDVRGSMAAYSPAINLGMLAFLWWCTSKLVWDCTLIDEDADSSGAGLLQVAGFEKEEKEGEKAPDPTLDLSATTEKEARRTVGYWEALLERRKRPHAPGVWVMYFSLGALPLFGLGQLLIPAADVGTRRYAFGLLCIYVASALALLVTTSFLGLRRYLRQRYLEMPGTMAATWIAVGGIMILGVMLFAALLPRPNAEYEISQLPIQFGSPEETKTSQLGMGRDGPRDDEHGTQPGQSDPNAQAQTESGDSKDGPPGTDSSKQQGSSDSQSSEPKTEQQNSDGENGSKGEAAESSQAESGTQQQRNSPSGESPQAESNSQQSSQENVNAQNADAPNSQAAQSDAQDGANEQASKSDPIDKQLAELEQRNERYQSFASQLLGARTNLTGWIASALKWLVYLAVVVVVAVVIFRNFPAIWGALQELWAKLFGGGERSAAEAEEEASAAATPARPFSSYADPFQTGLAQRYSVEELIKYTFEAFEAWARDNRVARTPEQTPHEFAASVGAYFRPLAADARHLADLYSRVAYARGKIPAASVQQLKQLWSRLNAGVRIAPPVQH